MIESDPLSVRKDNFSYSYSMGALPSQSYIILSRTDCSPRYIDFGPSGFAHPRILDEKLSSVKVTKVLRRSVLQLFGFTPIVVNTCALLAAPIMEMKEPDVIRTLKLASGVRIQEIVEGDGREAHEGDLVEVNYVCRRSNGYFVHSTVDQFSGESAPVIIPLDDKQVIKGLKEVLIGMRAGGKRRALIPPSVGYISESLKPIPEEFGPRRSLLSHAKEPLIFEVQLLKVL